MGHTVKCCGADAFFSQNGPYRYDSRRIAEAHAWCLGEVMATLSEGKVGVSIVDNTHISKWEYANWIRLANLCQYTPVVVETRVVCDASGPDGASEAHTAGDAESIGWLEAELCMRRNTHGVPANKIETMWRGWQHDPTAWVWWSAAEPPPPPWRFDSSAPATQQQQPHPKKKRPRSPDRAVESAAASDYLESLLLSIENSWTTHTAKTGPAAAVQPGAREAARAVAASLWEQGAYESIELHRESIHGLGALVCCPKGGGPKSSSSSGARGDDRILAVAMPANATFSQALSEEAVAMFQGPVLLGVHGADGSVAAYKVAHGLGPCPPSG